jgi:flagellar biosynthesis protein FliP
MNTINLPLYNVLRKALSLSEEDSQNIAKAFQEAIAEKVEEKETTTKEFVSREFAGVATKEFVAKEVAELKTELKTDIANLRAEMKADKFDMIKWMFIFWVGQLAAMFGLLYFFIKK